MFGFVAERLGVSADQVIFFSSQIVSVWFGVLYRTQLSPACTSRNTRHAVGAAAGLVLLYWCYGWSLLHMVVQCFGVYLIMILMPSHLNYRFAFLYAMVYLIYIHVIRVGGLPTFASPMMWSTTKLTGLVFSVHDGVHKKKESLSPYQLKYALRRYPSLIELVGYVFHFSGLICGPTFFFRDYLEFNSGENYVKDKSSFTNNNFYENDENRRSSKEAISSTESPTKDVVRKLTVAVLCLLVYLFVACRFPVELSAELPFIESHGFLYRCMYLTVSVLLVRYRYYFAWVMGEAIQNAAGLGLQYVDGKPQWDLTSNVNILKLDKPTSFKEIADNWNITTSKWLRLTAYERSGKYRLVWTYSLSSLWHGLEPGYFMSAGTGTLVHMAARKVRKTVRPFFLDTKWKWGYDVATGLAAQYSVLYTIASFHFLHWTPTYTFYTHSMYYWWHIVVVLVIITPVPHKIKEAARKEKAT